MTTLTLHSSLRAKTNLVLAVVWLAALLGDLFLLGHIPWSMVSLGLVSGLVQGFLQRRALRDGSTELRSARSALEVRAALVATAAGRAQIKVLWGSLAAYVAAAVIQGEAPTSLRFVPLLFAAILAQWCARESLTVGACAELEKADRGALAS